MVQGYFGVICPQGYRVRAWPVNEARFSRLKAQRTVNGQRSKVSNGSPSSKALSTPIPRTGEGLLLGVCPLVSLHMLDPPKPISQPRGFIVHEPVWSHDDAYLNHLLQYLQGKVLGFGCFMSPFPSGLPAGGPCGDCTESIMPGRLQSATTWGYLSAEWQVVQCGGKLSNVGPKSPEELLASLRWIER